MYDGLDDNSKLSSRANSLQDGENVINFHKTYFLPSLELSN